MLDRPRRAAAQAIASFSELTEGSDDESSPQLQGKVSYPRRAGGRTPLKPRSSVTRPPRPPASELSTTPIKLPRPLPRPISKRTKQTSTPTVKPPSNVRGSDSELTPLSSPICSPTTPKSKLLERPPETPYQINKRRAEPTPSSSTPHSWGPPPADSWDVSKLGTYVWVLLDGSAHVLDPECVTDPAEQSNERLWWPGKVLLSTRSLTEYVADLCGLRSCLPLLISL